MAPEAASSFSVSVVLPASGCEMIAKVRRDWYGKSLVAGAVWVTAFMGRTYRLYYWQRKRSAGGQKKGAASGGPPISLVSLRSLTLNCLDRCDDYRGCSIRKRN